MVKMIVRECDGEDDIGRVRTGRVWMLIQVQLSKISVTACWFFFSSAAQHAYHTIMHYQEFIQCSNTNQLLTPGPQMRYITYRRQFMENTHMKLCIHHIVDVLTSSAVSPPTCTLITMMVLWQCSSTNSQLTDWAMWNMYRNHHNLWHVVVYMEWTHHTMVYTCYILFIKQ